MTASDVAIGVILLLETLTGVLGNFFLLCNYLFLHFMGSRLKSMYLILIHLIIANFLTLFCKGIPQTIVAFDLKCFLSDFGCKLLFCLYRLGRGVSFSSTCLLSIFQAITISPQDSSWAGFKSKAPKYIGFSIYLSWMLYFLVGIGLLKYITRKRCSQNITGLMDLGYCSSVNVEETMGIQHGLYATIPDAVCMVLMLWASSSMVLILHRHKQRMQHMHRTTISPGSPPESRATKTILLLVIIFVFFCIFSCIFNICLTSFVNISWLLVQTRGIVSVGFSSVSPFLLIRHGSSMPSLYFICLSNRKAPSVGNTCRIFTSFHSYLQKFG